MILASEAKQISDASLEVYVKSFVKDLMAEVLPKIIEAAKWVYSVSISLCLIKGKSCIWQQRPNLKSSDIMLTTTVMSFPFTGMRKIK
jgi:hypothetical protein